MDRPPAAPGGREDGRCTPAASRVPHAESTAEGLDSALIGRPAADLIPYPTPLSTARRCFFVRTYLALRGVPGPSHRACEGNPARG